MRQSARRAFQQPMKLRELSRLGTARSRRRLTGNPLYFQENPPGNRFEAEQKPFLALTEGQPWRFVPYYL